LPFLCLTPHLADIGHSGTLRPACACLLDRFCFPGYEAKKVHTGAASVATGRVAPSLLAFFTSRATLSLLSGASSFPTFDAKVYMWRQQPGAQREAQREAQPGGTQPGAVLPTTGSGGEPAVTLKALGGLALTRKIHEAAAWHEANRQHKRLL